MFFGGIPGFPGGMPGGDDGPFGGGRRGSGGPKKPVDNESFYKVLDLEKKSNPSQAEIKKAYRKLAIKHHPDKGKR